LLLIVADRLDIAMSNIVPFPATAEADAVAQLDTGERLFVWGFRTLAQHRGCDCAIVAAIHQMYRQSNAEPAFALLDTLLDAFRGTAHTPIEIHDACCPCMSECEAHLLDAMAAAQSGDLDAARRQFERWLPGLAADWIVGPARELGSVFQSAGMTLPRRDLEAKAAAASPARIWSAASSTRH
jgi:hypothetical protein